MSDDLIRQFQRHVERCQQCTDHPFDLCQIGGTLLEQAGYSRYDIPPLVEDKHESD